MNTPLNSHVSRIKPLFDYLKKQRDNRRFVERLEIAATFVLVSFFLFFAIRPTVLTISTLLGDIESKKILRQELRSKINDVIQAQESFSEVQERYQVINNSLPDKPNYYQAAYQLQKTGESLGININKIAFNLSDTHGTIPANVEPYTIYLDVNGDFSSSTKLVSDLLNNQRIMEIKSINFSRVSEKDSNLASISSPEAQPTSSSLKTRFSVRFYYWPTTPNVKK